MTVVNLPPQVVVERIDTRPDQLRPSDQINYLANGLLWSVVPPKDMEELGVPLNPGSGSNWTYDKTKRKKVRAKAWGKFLNKGSWVVSFNVRGSVTISYLGTVRTQKNNKPIKTVAGLIGKLLTEMEG